MNQNQRSLLSFAGLSSLSIFAIILLIHEQTFINFCGVILLSTLFWPWFSIMHSCGHQAYSKNKLFNTIIGHIASCFVLVPFTGWKYHHQAHHQWTGYKGKDPTCSDIELPAKEKLKFINFLWKIWFPILSLGHVITNLWNYRKTTTEFQHIKNIKIKTLISIFLVPLFYLLLVKIAGSKILILFFISLVPFLLSADGILLSQHALLPMKEYKEGDKPLPLKEHHRYTRSITFGKFIDRYILLNFNEHLLHHENPTLPHFGLHKKELLNKGLKVDGFKWLWEIRKYHIRDVLTVPQEGPHV